MTAKKKCTACADWDGSPNACQKRTQALLATIPEDVRRVVIGQKVIQAGVCPAKFVGRKRDFGPATTFDDAIHRLANGSCLGLLSGFISFQDGDELKFEADAFKEYKSAKKRRLIQGQVSIFRHQQASRNNTILRSTASRFG
jgi:hypothetical protein